MRYAELVEGDPTTGRPPCVVMYSRRRIQAGEELFASYGKLYWRQWGDELA
jgi:hypothetical protein